MRKTGWIWEAKRDSGLCCRYDVRGAWTRGVVDGVIVGTSRGMRFHLGGDLGLVTRCGNKFLALPGTIATWQINVVAVVFRCSVA